MSRNRHLMGLGVGLMLAALGASATRAVDSGGSSKGAGRVWPPPPATARVAAEGSFAGPAELGLGPSWGERFVNLLTGGDRGREKLGKPFGIAVDEAGNLCVTDTGANVVWFFDRAKGRCSRWEKIDQVRFVAPVAVAKAEGVIYVADSGLRQVVAFDESGRIRFRITKLFSRPAGLALSGGRLYVADAGAHAVLIFDRQGRLQQKFGNRGAAAGEFNFPTHVAADGDGRIYVTDAMNARVQVFDGEGRFLSALGSVGDGSGHFSRPKGVAVDRGGHVYVTDALFDNVQVFDRSGGFLLNLGSSGSAPGEFWMPAGIAISGDNRIYVADACNGRVQVLRYLGQP